MARGRAHRCAEIPTLAVLPHTFCSHLAMHGVPTLLATLGQRRQVTELEVPCVARSGGRFNGDGVSHAGARRCGERQLTVSFVRVSMTLRPTPSRPV